MNLSRCPFFGLVFDLDLLLCTGFDLEHAVLFLCHRFTQRPMNTYRGSKFSSSKLVVACSNCYRVGERPVLVLAHPTGQISPSSAGELPQELGR